MKGNAKVIQALNDVLAAELVGINQYFLHSKMCKNWGYERLAHAIYHESIGEFLGTQAGADGKPVYDRLSEQLTADEARIAELAATIAEADDPYDVEDERTELATVTKRRDEAKAQKALLDGNRRMSQRLNDLAWSGIATDYESILAFPELASLSDEQKAYAEKRMKKAKLADRVEIRLADYRELDERFDAVASVEMVEAVGEEYWDDYLAAISRSLKPGGRAALQLISMDPAIFDGYAASPDFIQTYIFPGGMLLNEPQFEALARERGLGWDDREGFRLDYAETLSRWRQRYNDAVARGALPGFGEPFHQLWRYYLMYCEGGFRGGAIDVAQVTMVRA